MRIFQCLTVAVVCIGAIAANAETIELDTGQNLYTNPPVFTSEPLDDGVSYLVTAEGTWSAWDHISPTESCGAPEPVMFTSPLDLDQRVYYAAADAAYVFACPGPGQQNYNPDRCERVEPPGGWIAHSIEFSLDAGGNWFHPVPVISVYNPSHVYEYIVIGQGMKAGFQQARSPADDDHGILKFTIERLALPDSDGDGVPDDSDICSGGDDNLDTDQDSVPDFCDGCPLDVENDADADGVCESLDNCPTVANANQSDLDEDGEGDICDADLDGDSIANSGDNCVFDANADQADFDQDGAGNVCDADVDGDEVIDADDACVPTPGGEVVNVDGCSISQLVPCDGGWKNHGAYASSIAHTANAFRKAGLITEEARAIIQGEAVLSPCGQKTK